MTMSDHRIRLNASSVKVSRDVWRVRDGVVARLAETNHARATLGWREGDSKSVRNSTRREMLGSHDDAGHERRIGKVPVACNSTSAAVASAKAHRYSSSASRTLLPSQFGSLRSSASSTEDAVDEGSSLLGVDMQPKLRSGENDGEFSDQRRAHDKVELPREHPRAPFLARHAIGRDRRRDEDVRIDDDAQHFDAFSASPAPPRAALTSATARSIASSSVRRGPPSAWAVVSSSITARPRSAEVATQRFFDEIVGSYAVVRGGTRQRGEEFLVDVDGVVCRRAHVEPVYWLAQTGLRVTARRRARCR